MIKIHSCFHEILTSEQNWAFKNLVDHGDRILLWTFFIFTILNSVDVPCTLITNGIPNYDSGEYVNFVILAIFSDDSHLGCSI